MAELGLRDDGGAALAIAVLIGLVNVAAIVAVVMILVKVLL